MISLLMVILKKKKLSAEAMGSGNNSLARITHLLNTSAKERQTD